MQEASVEPSSSICPQFTPHDRNSHTVARSPQFLPVRTMSLRSSAFYLASRGIAGAISFVTLSMFVRHLTPEAYAWLALANTVAAIAISSVAQPIHHTLARYLPSDPGALTGFRYVLFVVIGSTGLIAVGAEIAQWSMTVGVVGVATAAWAIGASQALLEFSAQIASTRLEPRRYTQLYLTKSALTFGLGGAAVLAGWGAPGVSLVMALGFFLPVLMFESAILTGVTQWHLTDVWRIRLMTFTVPLGAAIAMNTSLQWADRFVLAAYTPASQLGIYSAVQDITQQTLGLLFGSLSLAWSPRIVRAHESKDTREHQRLASSYATLGLMLLLPTAGAIFSLRHVTTDILFDHQSQVIAATVMPAIVVATTLSGVRTWFIDIGFSLSGRMRTLLRNVAVAAGFNVLLNVTLVPAYGIRGAALVAVSSQALALALSAWSTRDVISWGVPRSHWLPPVASSGLMVLVLELSDLRGAQGLLLGIAMGGCVYAGSMLTVNGCGCRDWLLHRVVGRR